MPAHNLYTGMCMKCGSIVKKGAGFASRVRGRWKAIHLECTAARKAKEKQK